MGANEKIVKFPVNLFCSLMLLIPITALAEIILICYGKTQYCFAVSMVVNLVYYPIMYGLMLKGIFTPNITFICMMFGFGMVVHLGGSIICFAVYKRSLLTRKNQ